MASRSASVAGSVVVVLLAASLVAIALAPVAVPASYSWVEHTTSESAAQGVEGAWVARLGFVLFGLAVLWLANLPERRWGRAGTALHRCFGVSMLAVAAFSTRPWGSGVPFDRTEDLLHSVASFAVGFGFIAGVVAVTVGGWAERGRRRVLDVMVVVVAVGASSAMTAAEDLEGVLQRAMFLAAYVWYCEEALSVARSGRRAPPPRSLPGRRHACCWPSSPPE